MRTHWIGDLSKGCDICKSPFGKVMYDCSIPTARGTWGNICRICFQDNGCKIGIGYGQKYKLDVKSGRYELVEGGR